MDAMLHVPCRYLQAAGNSARCAAHGFTGPNPRGPTNRANLVDWAVTGSWWWRTGGRRFAASRRLPDGFRCWPVGNPCALAACRTADNLRGAACCRDLQIEIMCTNRQHKLEALVRSRRSPYLCKVERAGDYSIEAEMISACGYLDDDGIGCTLHERRRADGRPAKPDLCSDWPPKKHTLHPGCVFARRGMRPDMTILCNFPQVAPSSWATRWKHSGPVSLERQSWMSSSSCTRPPTRR